MMRYISAIVWLIIAALWTYRGISEQNDIYMLISAVFILVSTVERKGREE